MMLTDVPNTTWADVNADGIWCPNCGEHIAAPWNISENWEEPDECRTCGYPENIEKMGAVV